MTEFPSSKWADYELIDCGCGEKLERYGNVVMARPEPKAIWDRSLPLEKWDRMMHTRFSPGAGFGKAGKEDCGTWSRNKAFKDQWYISYHGLQKGLDSNCGLGSPPSSMWGYSLSRPPIGNTFMPTPIRG